MSAIGAWLRNSLRDFDIAFLAAQSWLLRLSLNLIGKIHQPAGLRQDILRETSSRALRGCRSPPW
jgi:hypothetical protein